MPSGLTPTAQRQCPQPTRRGPAELRPLRCRSSRSEHPGLSAAKLGDPPVEPSVQFSDLIWLHARRGAVLNTATKVGGTVQGAPCVSARSRPRAKAEACSTHAIDPDQHFPLAGPSVRSPPLETRAASASRLVQGEGHTTADTARQRGRTLRAG